MRCFCAQAQKQVDKCEIYLAISGFILHIVTSFFITVCLLTVSITAGRPTRGTTCFNLHLLKRANLMQFTKWKRTSSYYSIKFSKLSQIKQLTSSLLLSGVGMKECWFESMQIRSIHTQITIRIKRVDSNQPGFEAVWELGVKGLL